MYKLRLQVGPRQHVPGGVAGFTAWLKKEGLIPADLSDADAKSVYNSARTDVCHYKPINESSTRRPPTADYAQLIAAGAAPPVGASAI